MDTNETNAPPNNTDPEPSNDNNNVEQLENNEAERKENPENEEPATNDNEAENASDEAENDNEGEQDQSKLNALTTNTANQLLGDFVNHENEGGGNVFETTDPFRQNIEIQTDNATEPPNDNGGSKSPNQLSKTQPVNSSSPPRPPFSKSLRSPRGRPKTPTNPDEIDALSNQFKNGAKVNCQDPDLLGATITDMEEKRDDLINSQQFTESIKFQHGIDTAKTQHIDLIKKQVSQEMQEDLSLRKNDTQENLNNLLKTMKEREQQLEDEYKEKENILRDRQEQEMVEFEQEWASEEKRRMYNRSSQRLRVLRTQQTLLLKTKRFEEAMQVSKLADNLANQETKQNGEKMLADYNMARSILEKRQKDEYETFVKKYDDRRNELQGLKQQMSKPYLNRLNALQLEEEIAKDPERVYSKKRSEINELATRQIRTSKVTIRAEVSDFNTLPLPPLPMPASARKSARSNREAEQTA